MTEIYSLDHGAFKQKRGMQACIIVPPEVTPNVILDAAVTKHVPLQHIQDGTEHVLMYPGGRLVETLLGLDEPFTLAKYKDDLGKPYRQIVLFHCPEQGW